MEQASDDVFSRPVFAGNQHIRVRRANPGDQLEDRLHGGRGSNKIRHALGAQKAVLEFQLAGTAQRLAKLGVNPDERKEPLVFPGFLNKVTRAPLDAFSSEVYVAPRR